MREVNGWIGVTGAAGRLGRLVVDELARRATGRVIALTRHEPDTLPPGVSWRYLEYDDVDSVAGALGGVGSLLLIASNAPDPVRRVQHRVVLETAARAGATRLAYTSLSGADRRDTSMDALHRDTERVLAGTGVPWLALRNAEYTENWTSSAHEHLQAGVVALDLAPTTAIASATRADLASATAALLVAPQPGSPVVDLAGASTWTPVEYTRVLSQLTSTALSYRRHSRAQQREVWRGRGLPEHVVELLATVHSHADAGSFAASGQALRAALGRPAHTLTDAMADALAQTGTPATPAPLLSPPPR